MRPLSQITQAMPHYPIIELIDKDFEIPQLGKKRRIWALLPHDYYDSDKQYPVLYLQDAQNLFDEDAPFGSWSIDRHLMELSAAGHGDLIVICIDHGGKERIQEYSPYQHRKFGEGQGKDYANFIIETLKPYVDGHYRIKAAQDLYRHRGKQHGWADQCLYRHCAPKVFFQIDDFQSFILVFR